MPLKPDASLLKRYAPLSVWWEAERQALRSTMRTHRMGAVIFDASFQIAAKGTAHRSERFHTSHRSIHAEEHACQSLAPHSHKNLTALIVGLSKAGNWIANSCPCARCVNYLSNNNITRVMFATRSDTNWSITTHSVSELASLTKTFNLSHAYAKHLRIAT